jgi:hypothetical protein
LYSRFGKGSGGEAGDNLALGMPVSQQHHVQFVAPGAAEGDPLQNIGQIGERLNVVKFIGLT